MSPRKVEKCGCGFDYPDRFVPKCARCGIIFGGEFDEGDKAWEVSNMVNDNVERYDFSISKKSARVAHANSQNIKFSETRVKKFTWTWE